MTTLSPVPAAPAPNTTQSQHQRVPVEYGAAITHRDLVREKLRVDPASIAHKKRAMPEHRRADHRGQHVDIKV
ncbi:MAG: hypothetical protein JNL81_16975 [Hyphomonadaceae bacterium]|nr:hypothetical protein [Hyphomonadaceae bacterium]